MNPTKLSLPLFCHRNLFQKFLHNHYPTACANCFIYYILHGEKWIIKRLNNLFYSFFRIMLLKDLVVMKQILFRGIWIMLSYDLGQSVFYVTKVIDLAICWALRVLDTGEGRKSEFHPKSEIWGDRCLHVLVTDLQHWISKHMLHHSSWTRMTKWTQYSVLEVCSVVIFIGF